MAACKKCGTTKAIMVVYCHECASDLRKVVFCKNCIHKEDIANGPDKIQMCCCDSDNCRVVVDEDFCSRGKEKHLERKDD